MAKLVILSQGMAGRSLELKVDKTTIGRVDDNTFPIVEPSVSSHHCEILLRGADVVVHDLNSTNGTFINGDQITGEAVLKPGQILKLGQIELKLEAEGAPVTPTAPVAASPSAAPAPAAPAPSKKAGESTHAAPRGVSLTDFEQGAKGFDTSGKGFTKKDNKVNKIFLIVAIVVGVIIVGLVLFAFMSASKPAN
jgi:pSer/pThr/pTyr-binding forkhead associated (FHA) protein